jgi:hypothetical protein
LSHKDYSVYLFVNIAGDKGSITEELARSLMTFIFGQKSLIRYYMAVDDRENIDEIHFPKLEGNVVLAFQFPGY